VKPVIGIDLGTTNCALAYTRGDSVEQLAIPQLVNPGETRAESLLPSFVFLDAAGPIVGILAQKLGLENAGRLVASAKSTAGTSWDFNSLPVTVFSNFTTASGPFISQSGTEGITVPERVINPQADLSAYNDRVGR
jgi:molecular chaperone DnaK (HSP70)